jgi:hypothetical protein
MGGLSWAQDLGHERQARPDLVTRQRQVPEEISMGPARPVVRLPGWLFEILLHPARFELIEQGAVVEQRVPAAALSVAGNLSAFDC